ncbi:MAG: nucleotide exchange factor GrpE, partial [Thermoanaerobaculia bacterium]
EESESVMAPTVAVELQRGYRLNDRLLRPSLVKVAVPKESADDGSTSNPSQ